MLKWTGAACGVLGALGVALNLGLVLLGFGLFLYSSIAWLIIGTVQREWSMVSMQAVFTVINIVGIVRWM